MRLSFSSSAMKSLVLAIMASASLSSAWMPTGNGKHPHQTRTMHHEEQNVKPRSLPSNLPIRGVNLGSQFIVEPWMATDEWNSMGCNGMEHLDHQG